MNVTYGFNSTMTAKPGMGEDLIALLSSGLTPGNPGSSEFCIVYLVARSASNPDVVHITEGWTSEEDHHRLFASDEAQALVAQFADLLAEDAVYTDYVPVTGKAF